MTRNRTALIVGSVGAIAASSLAFAMWMTNGIVYGSIVGLKDREHDLAIAGERATIALIAVVLLQGAAMFTTALWLPRGQLSGVAGTTVRFALALAISVGGAGVTLAVILQISRWVH